MDSILKSDIFFFITTVAIVIVTACIIVVMVYVVRILQDVKSVAELARKESELLSSDLGELRSRIQMNGFRWLFVGHFLRKFWQRRSKKKKSKEDTE